VNSRIRAKTDGSLFTEPTPHPRGYTPISQNGSIAPVYILLWTNEGPKKYLALVGIDQELAGRLLGFF
jgi:hypothetical protein